MQTTSHKPISQFLAKTQIQASNYKLLDAAIFSSKTIETISEDSSIKTMSEGRFLKNDF